MGCGPSVQSNRGGNEAAEKYRNAPRSFDETPEHHDRMLKYLELAHPLLHKEQAFDLPLTEAEAVQHRKLEDEWSIHSRGDLVVEPSDDVLAKREAAKVSEAHSEHDINADPNQFEPTPEPASEIAKSVKQVEGWFTLNDQLIAKADRDQNSSFSDSASAESHAGGASSTSSFSSPNGGFGRSPSGLRTDVTTPDDSYVGGNNGTDSGTRGTLGLSAGSAATGLLSVSDMSGTVNAMDMGRVMRKPGGGSGSAPHVLATPGTPFLGAGPRMPLRADVLASHLRRLRALERGETPPSPQPKVMLGGNGFTLSAPASGSLPEQ